MLEAIELVAAELVDFDDPTLLLLDELTLVATLELLEGVQLVLVGNASGVSPVRLIRKLLAGTFSVMPSENKTYCALQPKL